MKNIYAVILFCLVSYASFSQDVHFSQFYFSPLTMNPALTGNFEGTWRVGVNYRNQWGSISAPAVYSTPSAFADFKITSGYFSHNYLGLGFLLLTDKAGDGDLTTTSAMISASYQQSLDNSGNYHISVGGMWGWTQKGIDITKLQFFDQFNGSDFVGTTRDPITNNTFAYTDLMGGIAFNALLSDYSNFNMGGSVAHIAQPVESFYKSSGGDNEIGVRYVIHAGATFGINNQVYLFPSALYQLQSSSQEIVAGTGIGYNFSPSRYRVGTIVYIGVFDRVNDAVIPTMGIIVNGLKVGLSYDINTSPLSVATGGEGGFEVALIYTGGKVEKKNKRTFCPTF